MALAQGSWGFILAPMGTQPCSSCKEHFAPPKSCPSVKVCGRCRGRQQRQKSRESIEIKARDMATKARSRARAKKIPCEIDALWIVTAWYAQHGRCYFSGRTMTLNPGPQNVSLDRLSSAKGYTRKNTVLVALRVNSMKSDLPVSEFLEWCASITAHGQRGAR